MPRKKFYTALVLLVLLASVFTWKFLQPEKVDASKIFEAAQTYTRETKAQGLMIPPVVSMQELINRKLLNPADVRGLSGAEVTVSLTANKNDPQAIIIRARFPDGHEILTLADGSVQSKP